MRRTDVAHGNGDEARISNRGFARGHQRGAVSGAGGRAFV
jgi:hypothetical protein